MSITLRYWKLVLLYVLYVFVSCIALALTSGGWSILFLPLYYSFAVYTPLGVTLIAVLAALLLEGKKDIALSKKWIIALGGLQFLSLLFTTGDCGDADCPDSVFYQSLLGTTMVQTTPWVIYLGIGIKLLYVLAVYVFFSLYVYKKNHIVVPIMGWRRVVRSLLVFVALVSTFVTLFLVGAFVFGW